MDDEYRKRHDGTVTDGTDKQLKDPSLQQRKLFMALSRKQSQRSAVREAGYSDKSDASQIVARLSETTLRTELELLGLNPQSVAKRIMDGLDGDTIKPIGQGLFETIPDWTNRHRYMTTALRMFGVQVTGTHTGVDRQAPDLHINVYKQVFNLIDQSLQMQGHREVKVEVVE